MCVCVCGFRKELSLSPQLICGVDRWSALLQTVCENGFLRLVSQRASTKVGLWASRFANATGSANPWDIHFAELSKILIELDSCCPTHDRLNIAAGLPKASPTVRGFI